MDAILDWQHDIRSIPENGLEVKREATEAERTSLAKALELVTCKRLLARYAIQQRAGGHFHLAGKVDVSVTQTCVVTLEEIERSYTAPLDVELWPAETLADTEMGEDVDPLGADREAIEDGRIDIGRIIYEELASAIDPFPRRDDAAFEWEDREGAERTHPFAALEKLKRKDG